MAGSSNVSSTKRLLGAAAPLGASLKADDPARAGRLLNELFETLGPVIGRAGVRATFARSVKLRALAYPCLAPLLTARAEQQRNDAELAMVLVRVPSENGKKCTLRVGDMGLQKAQTANSSERLHRRQHPAVTPPSAKHASPSGPTPSAS